jgi:branched-chain amino acid transport system permease protein
MILWLENIKQSFVRALVAFIIFGPITGLILDGFNITFNLKRPLILTAIVFIGSLLIGILKSKTIYIKIASKLSSSTKPHVHVKKTLTHPLRALLWLSIGITLPFILSKYWLGVAILSLIYVLLGLGLNIVVGLAGLLDLGFVAFYAVGAYGYALGSEYLGLGFWAALPLCAMMSATFGAILGFPVLRMHGDYLAIVTLGFGEIIRLLLNNWSELTGGPNGVSAPPPTFFGLEFTRTPKQGGVSFHEVFQLDYSSSYKYIFIYCVLFLTVCIMLRFVSKLQHMPMGRAWEALREDEIACRSLGINHVTTKLSAFSMGAMVGGLGGVFFAAFQGFINPSSFTFIESAIILAIVVLGGLGSTVGVVIAAILLTMLPELLREFAQFRMLFFGLVMVLMMVWRPRGLVRLVRQWFSPPSSRVYGKT